MRPCTNELLRLKKPTLKRSKASDNETGHNSFDLMPSVLKLALLFLSLVTVIAQPAAAAGTDDDSTSAVLLSPDQGEALAVFALQSEKRIRSKPDCSHLVHQLYARAGLIYPYEDSRVLYLGSTDFQRVKKPQAGDLVVWLGHVGIVLSTEEKTFISSVHSGILTETWMAPHWVRRGHPRFYRYRIGPEADMNLLAKIMGNETQQTDTWTNARSGTGEELPSPAETRESDGVEQQIDTLSPQNARSMSESGHDSNSIVALINQRQMPSKRQIAVAMIEGSKAHARRLMEGETLDVVRPFAIFSRLEVEKIKIKHEKGWVTFRLSETMSQENGRILPARTTERELAISRRNDGFWVISDPQGRTYLPEEHALEVFEHQTALFLRQAPNSSNTRVIVKTLDRLYDQQPGAPQQAAIR